MPLSTSDTKNVKLGVCNVAFGGEDLGLTKGGVTVEVQTSTHKVNVDQFGQTEVNEYINGRMVKVRVPLAESTLDRLEAVIPGSELVVDGVDPDVMRLDVSYGNGVSLLDIAQELVCHPRDNAPGDKSEDFVVPLAATAGAFSFAYKIDEERVYEVEFTGYVDKETGKLFHVGDADATA